MPSVFFSHSTVRILRTFLVVLIALVADQRAFASTTDIVVIRDHPQVVHIYGTRGGDPIIVSSGDGGWVHLGPHIAQTLAARGYFVVGFNAKAYLESFTSATSTLRPQDVPADFRELAAFAARGSTKRPILIGVSEGAGLSVLAAVDAPAKAALAGVIAIGLPDVNELGWRWKDSWIYVSHGVPNEPTFSTASLVNRVAPLPLAAIHSTQDEFVPLRDAQRVMQSAIDPKRLWVVTASDHRFSDNQTEFDQRLLDALTWVTQNTPR